MLTRPDGSTFQVETRNTYSPDQFEWFVAGSAINRIRAELSDTIVAE